VVLNHSDIAVVVWDGECQGKRGGTKETFDAARRQGVPVIWLDARQPHAWQMVDALSPLPVTTPGARLTPQATEPAQKRLREQVREILVIPNACEPGGAHGRGLSESPEQGLRAYYAEREPRVRLAGIWTLFRNLVGDGRISRVPLRVPSFEEAIAQAPETETPRDGSTPAAALNDRLRLFYEWPDKLAVLYSDRYRGAFILTFLLAAVAVGMALFPLALGLADHSLGEMALTVLELVTIGSSCGLCSSAAGGSGTSVGSTTACWRRWCEPRAWLLHWEGHAPSPRFPRTGPPMASPRRHGWRGTSALSSAT